MTEQSTGEEDGGIQTSGIDDEDNQAKTPAEGESVLNDDAGHALTREDIEAGRDDDANVSADQLQRSGTTNQIHGDMIDLGK